MPRSSTWSSARPERLAAGASVYPETKHPTYHRELGLPLEDRVLEVLTHAGMNNREAPVFIQSFEVSNLQYLRTRTRVKLIQLIDGDDVAANGTVSSAAVRQAV